MLWYYTNQQRLLTAAEVDDDNDVWADDVTSEGQSQHDTSDSAAVAGVSTTAPSTAPSASISISIDSMSPLQFSSSTTRSSATAAESACYQRHTHSHFTALLDSVQDYLGESVPER